MATWSGWIAVACILFAASLPLAYRLKNGKRAPPSSALMRSHVVVGLGVSTIGFLHAVTVVPSLGDPAAVGAGAIAMAPGAVAIFVLVAHTGIGLQLRQEKLKQRAQKRRAHLITAITIVVFTALHVIALRRG